MNVRQHRSHEERNLLNPAFCSTILWYGCKGAKEYAASPRRSLSYIESFLLLPIVLHQKSRASLPIQIRSSLPVWINSQPLHIASLPDRAQTLVPYTKEAIILGCSSQLLHIEGNELFCNTSYSRKINKSSRSSSDEVRECFKKAEFLGKWFAHTGSPETIFTLFEVRP